MLIKANLLAVFQTFLALKALATTNAPIVDLGYAQYQGSVDPATNTTSFLGIRYAAPPIGELRWVAPQPPLATSGIQQAITQPNECYQAPVGVALTNPFESTSLSKRDVSQSEDCLFLNVYTPGNVVMATPSGGLPVVVWIHGGGYIFGAASLYDGADLIVDSNYGVITVVLQYRLGLFGFLPGEAVKEGGALNAGLLDQNYALQWVRAHISQFGGDPTKVTIWGQSAGAGSVIQHVVAQGGNTQPPLFRTAMTSSTFVASQYNYNDRIPEVIFCGSSSDTLSCLRTTDVNTLQTLNYNISLDGFYGMIPFVPVVDGTFIVERPTVTLSKGRLNGNYLLSVVNTHEGNILVNQSTTMNVTDFIRTIYPNFGPPQITEAAAMYQNMGSNVNQANNVMSDSMFLCPTYYMLEAFGERAWKKQGLFAIPPGLHGMDVGEYFTSYTGGPSYNNSQFITSFSNSFMAMAMFETPDHRYTPGDITPSWNIWQQGFTEMVFNKTSEGEPHVCTSKTDLALLERFSSLKNSASLTKAVMAQDGSCIGRFIRAARSPYFTPRSTRLETMLIKTNLLAVSQTFLALEALATTNAPIVGLGYAQYQGSVDPATNTTSFLGIRYAAPPIGNLRWAAPQPPSTTPGIQQAITQPSECYQAPLGNASTSPLESMSLSKRDVSQSEDCLFLNIYTPGNVVVATPSGGLPVVVWIHGGGYISGAASLYDGADLIVESNYGVITVVLQYRLGLFGFLAGEAVKEGGALNAGLLDQNYAFQWVQAHISQFGGDPTKVTIWGESAGASSVIQHIVAHGGNTQPSLFRAAMTSSMFLTSQYNYNDRIPEVLYNMVVNRTNCSSSTDTLSCMRAADVNALQTLNYNINLNGLHGTLTFVPVVDGTFIVERPTVTLSKGRLNGVSSMKENHLLAVVNSHEGNIFVDQSMTMNVTDFIRTIFPNFGPAQITGAATMYQNMGSNVNQANLVMGESMFLCPTYYMLEAFGERAWKGLFAIPPGLHGMDVGEYFPSYAGGPSYNNPQFITSFSNSFMAMAMSETPDHRYTPGDITPSWNIWQQGFTEMVFNKTSEGEPHVHTSETDMALLKRCAYWQQVSAYTMQ
ncbi:Alpha/Beta hydrolase protein [Suillus spraguei]|nr:Alpha/Beta hydrolase protein [Suillus spraguei]